MFIITYSNGKYLKHMYNNTLIVTIVVNVFNNKKKMYPSNKNNSKYFVTVVYTTISFATYTNISNLTDNVSYLFKFSTSHSHCTI